MGRRKRAMNLGGGHMSAEQSKPRKIRKSARHSAHTRKHTAPVFNSPSRAEPPAHLNSPSSETTGGAAPSAELRLTQFPPAASFHNPSTNDTLPRSFVGAARKSAPVKHYAAFEIPEHDKSYAEGFADEHNFGLHNPKEEAEQRAKNQQMWLNPVLFQSIGQASYARGLVGYLSIPPTDFKETENHARNMDYISDPPLTEVRVCWEQSLTINDHGEDKDELVLRRRIVYSTRDGITMRDIFDLHHQHPDMENLVEFRTELGPDTYIEIPGATVRTSH